MSKSYNLCPGKGNDVDHDDTDNNNNYDCNDNDNDNNKDKHKNNPNEDREGKQYILKGYYISATIHTPLEVGWPSVCRFIS